MSPQFGVHSQSQFGVLRILFWKSPHKEDVIEEARIAQSGIDSENT